MQPDKLHLNACLILAHPRDKCPICCPLLRICPEGESFLHLLLFSRTEEANRAPKRLNTCQKFNNRMNREHRPTGARYEPHGVGRGQGVGEGLLYLASPALALPSPALPSPPAALRSPARL